MKIIEISMLAILSLSLRRILILLRILEFQILEHKQEELEPIHQSEKLFVEYMKNQRLKLEQIRTILHIAILKALVFVLV